MFFTRAILTYTKTNGNGEMYYIHPDHLGSIHVTIDINGSVVQELSFDACSVKLAFCDPPTGGETKGIAAQIPESEAKPEGRQRNATDWSYSALPAPKFDRGYTFHEHLPEFGLINMNGRMGVYPDKRSDIGNPLLGRFLSPDPVLQSPGDLQNYNRYSYVLNNPLKYTDPSGYITFSQEMWDFINDLWEKSGLHGGTWSSGSGWSNFSEDEAWDFAEDYANENLNSGGGHYEVRKSGKYKKVDKRLRGIYNYKDGFSGLLHKEQAYNYKLFWVEDNIISDEPPDLTPANFLASNAHIQIARSLSYVYHFGGYYDIRSEDLFDFDSMRKATRIVGTSRYLREGKLGGTKYYFNDDKMLGAENVAFYSPVRNTYAHISDNRVDESWFEYKPGIAQFTIRLFDTHPRLSGRINIMTLEFKSYKTLMSWAKFISSSWKTISSL